MDEFKVKLWGVRGSYPTPGKEAIKYGGNTTCVEVETDKGLIILDAGTGIVGLSKKIIAEKKYHDINIFFSHTHKDHTEGFTSFLPAYLGQYTLNLYGPKVLDRDIGETLSNSMDFSYFPVMFDEMNSIKNSLNIKDNNIIALSSKNLPPQIYNKYHSDYHISNREVVVEILRGYNHPKNGVYIYKIKYLNKTFVFATDVESYYGGDQKLIKFSHDADVLVHDAAYDEATYKRKQGWGHSTPRMAAENAKAANVKLLYLTHHDPEEKENDILEKEKAAQKIFKNSYSAYEGLEIDMLEED